MWGACWKNCVGPKVSSLALRDRCRLLERSVKPVLSFRNTRWPWTKALADAQNRTLRRMLSYFIHIQRLPDEPLDRFHRRRMRKVSDTAKHYGEWGVEHARRVLAWADHLKRSRNKKSLASELFCWHDQHWLHARRLNPDVGSGVLRPGTRAAPGPVVKRWDEALAGAEFFVRSLN